MIDDRRSHYNQVRPHSSLTSAAGSIRQTGGLQWSLIQALALTGEHVNEVVYFSFFHFFSSSVLSRPCSFDPFESLALIFCPPKGNSYCTRGEAERYYRVESSDDLLDQMKASNLLLSTSFYDKTRRNIDMADCNGTHVRFVKGGKLCSSTTILTAS